MGKHNIPTVKSFDRNLAMGFAVVGPKTQTMLKTQTTGVLQVQVGNYLR